MAELELTAHKNAAVAAGTVVRAEPKAAARSTGRVFEWTVFIAAATVLLVGGYESVIQCYLPAWSILSAAHAAGHLKAYPILYEPGKGIWHPLGWAGSAMMVLMMVYSVRKRVALLSSLGSMRHWLSMHMVLGIIGPLLVMLHTTFKLHGLIATSFWCMMVTMVFGILGRYIYVQIPRSITGAELGVKDIEQEVSSIDRELERQLRPGRTMELVRDLRIIDAEGVLDAVDGERAASSKAGGANPLKRLLDTIDGCDGARDRNPFLALLVMMKTDIMNLFRVRRLKELLMTRHNLSGRRLEEALRLVRKKAMLIRRRNLLSTSQKLLHHWHVLHVPLAIAMFIIMFVHVLVYYVFRPGI